MYWKAIAIATTVIEAVPDIVQRQDDNVDDRSRSKLSNLIRDNANLRKLFDQLRLELDQMKMKMQNFKSARETAKKAPDAISNPEPSQ
jgi:phosphopantothenate synthetase